MEKTSRKRKFFVLIGLALSMIAIGFVAAPLWFPWVLPSILKKFHVGYSSYERGGYNRFILRDVVFTEAESKFTADEVEVLFPTTFLWRNFKNDRSQNYLRVSHWALEFPHVDHEETSNPNSILQTFEELDLTLKELNRWVPKATLVDGKIRFSNQELLIPAAEWLNGDLAGRISGKELFPETFFHANLNPKNSQGILVENPTWNLGGELSITNADNQLLKIDGSALWQSNRVDFSAQFGREGRLPEVAFVKSESFRLPAQTIKLEGYRDLTGSLNAEWKTNRFTFDLTSQALPRRSKEIFLSPITVALHASGDTNSVRIETAAISSPWLHANLSKNVEFNFRGEMLSPNATLNIAADLSGQHWIDASGQLEGQATLLQSTNRFPETKFNLSGAAVGIEQVEIDRLDLEGEFNWPWLQISSIHVKFPEGANAAGSLKFNAVAREISEGKLHLDGSIGYKFLPPEISYKTASLTTEFSGPLEKLSHSGHVRLEGAKVPNLAPLGIEADWRGRLFDLKSFSAKISAKDSALVLGGSANVETNQINLQVEKLLLSKKSETILNLEKPFAASATKTNGTNSTWTLALEPFNWTGNETKLSVAGKINWPQEGNFSASARQFAFAQFADFVERPLPEVFIDKLDASAQWTNGPATFSLDGLTRFLSKDGTRFSAEIRGSGNKNGISVELAKVGTATESIFSGNGILPLTLSLGNRSNLVQVLPKQKIDFHAETIPNTSFWEQLEVWTDTGFHDPRVSLSISGTFDAPKGKLTASVEEIVFKSKKTDVPMPRLKSFLADFDVEQNRITLNRAEVLVEGQPVTASGELPLPKNLLDNWRKIFDWRKANVQLKIVDAQIAPFEKLFPKFLSPLGTVNLNLRMANGKLDGELRVADAALRPIPALGPVHDIAARVKFLGETVTLETFAGNLGGQPVNVTGEINLAKREANGFPDFHFNLRGTNVPLSRSADLILRSDLDLTIVNKNGSEPLVSGALNLRDSVFLSDLKLLVPGKIAKPKQRPPYFSVETQPFAKWRLDVAVRGTNFLKVRSPIFRGELSANLKVAGTLKEPVAVGDVKVNSGVVQFPFANLRIDSGFISLTSENPYRPKLSIAASARTYGYDVKMDVGGFADEPVVEFSSNPGLTSEQILLMVTAGELPRDELNFSTQQKAGRLAFFLGKNLLSKFGGNDASDDRLEIRSGENISEQGRQTYYMEYKLSDEWSIIGEYDRFGGLDAGFKWKFFEK